MGRVSQYLLNVQDEPDELQMWKEECERMTDLYNQALAQQARLEKKIEKMYQSVSIILSSAHVALMEVESDG